MASEMNFQTAEKKRILFEIRHLYSARAPGHATQGQGHTGI